MVRAIVFAIVLLIGGCTASVATLFIDKEFYSQEELAWVPMGWPFTFVHQDLSGYTPMSWPQSFSFVQPQDNPASVHLGYFAANVLLFGAAIWGITRAIRSA
jgi:hypothetical protein